jgi:hypothetical protein
MQLRARCFASYAFLNEPEPPDPTRLPSTRRCANVPPSACWTCGRKTARTREAAARRLLDQLEILRRPFQLEDGATTALASGDRGALVALLPPPPSTLGDDALDDETFATTAARVLNNVRKDPSDSALAEPT